MSISMCTIACLAVIYVPFPIEIWYHVLEFCMTFWPFFLPILSMWCFFNSPRLTLIPFSIHFESCWYNLSDCGNCLCFLSPARQSGGEGYWRRLGCPSVRPSVRPSALRPNVHISFPEQNSVTRAWISLTKQNVRFQVGLCSENFQLDQIKNGRLSAVINFNMPDI